MFNKEQKEWIEALLKEAGERASNEEKKTKLLSILDKVQSIPTSVSSITEKDLEIIHSALDNLSSLTAEYTAMTDIGGVEMYDYIKKRMGGFLETLSSYKSRIGSDFSYYEDYLKKELRAKIIKRMISDKESINGKVVSFTSAEKLVEADEEYLTVKKLVQSLERLNSEIKTKYDYYSKVWNLVFQSVSTSTKERFSQENNN